MSRVVVRAAGPRGRCPRNAARSDRRHDRFERAADVVRGADDGHPSARLGTFFELFAWTRGREDALIRFTAPTKDAGNATLKQGDQMWTFTPKLNRVIRLPFSMMSQGWAGSDFSYSDCRAPISCCIEYELTLVGDRNARRPPGLYDRAIPHDDAPVGGGRSRSCCATTMCCRPDVLRSGHATAEASRSGENRRRSGVGRLQRACVWRRSTKPVSGPKSRIRRRDSMQIDDGMFTVFALQSGRSQ